MSFELPNHLWGPQIRGIKDVLSGWSRGKSICLQGPTGSGKTTQASVLFQWAASQGLRGIFYVNRRLLVQQTVDRFRKDGLECAVRAAGMEHEFDLFAPFQVASADTERARCFKKEVWPFHDAQVVIIDEMHLQRTDTMKALIRHYKSKGAMIVGLTATPIGLSEWFDELVVSGTLQEYRDCGAIVHADVYSIGMPDMRKVKRNHSGEFVMDGEKKRVYTQSIVEDVFKMWAKHNPDARPTMLFAPGVAESVWMTEQFVSKGIPWAHVDATDCVVDGGRRKLDIPTWIEIQDRVKSGSIKGISNRFKCFSMKAKLNCLGLWMSVDELKVGSVVEAFDHSTGVSSFEPIKRIIRQSNTMPMVTIESGDGHFRVRVTGDHEVVVAGPGRMGWRKVSACDLIGIQFEIPIESEDGESEPSAATAHIDCDSQCGEVWCVTVESGSVWVKEDGIPVVMGNCREGLDIPSAYCAILATPIGSLASYLQIVGRVLRSHPSKDKAVVLDHGGGYWRLGSPNDDRDWHEWWSLPEHAVSEMHQLKIREQKTKEPICCPACQMERTGGLECPGCGHKSEKSRRMVIMENGEMKQYDGKLVKPKFVKREPNTEDIWTGMAHGWRRKKVDRTWNQLAGFFAHENGYHPPKDLKMMPRKEEDWYRPVWAVDGKDLY